MTNIVQTLFATASVCHVSLIGEKLKNLSSHVQDARRPVSHHKYRI
jgi:uncharacterized protein with HEPN domain